jgi:hypothetical protein
MCHKVLEGSRKLYGDGTAGTGSKEGKDVGFESGAVRLGDRNVVRARVWGDDV